jgi:hypothetical protein
MTIWLTRATVLSRHGIQEVEAKQDINDPDTVSWIDARFPKWTGSWTKGEGTNWHRTLEGAKIRAEFMRSNQIDALNFKIEATIKSEAKAEFITTKVRDLNEKLEAVKRREYPVIKTRCL